MKIRTLLLGSVVLAGFTTAGYAADLGVVTSLDVCDELGLSGLTISSDDNCLVITGEVKYEFLWGDYDSGPTVDVDNDITGNSTDNIAANGSYDHDSNITAWLKFVATADSDFGPASATIKLLVDGYSGTNPNVNLNEAYATIGDTTVLSAGLKGSIFEKGDDAPLNWLGLFNSSIVDAGVGGWDWVETGGHVIQVVSNLGNGVSVGGGLEDLSNNGTAVGVLKYAGDGITAHASFAVDDILGGLANSWMVHAGFTGTFDTVKVVGAAYFDNFTNFTAGTYYNVLGSVEIGLDMFKIAASVEADGDGVQNQWGAGASLSATVSEGVTLNVGGRYWQEAGGDVGQQAAVGVTAAVTETLTATAELGFRSDSWQAEMYGKGSLAWAPGGGFTASVAGEATSLGAYKATFTAAKTIK